MNDAKKMLVAAGVFLVGTGLVYGVVFMFSGESWSGPTSLRKPLLFGLSTGVTLLSLAWVARLLPAHRLDSVVYGSLAAALLIEVGLIDLQQARGVASHFNRTTEFDAFVQAAMTGLIAYASVLILAMTARSFGPLPVSRDEAFAARAGMVLLAAGCALGGVITLIGELNLRAGRAPEIFGNAGVLKFPHGLPLHAIQILYLQRCALVRFGIQETDRWRSLVASTAGLSAATLYGVVQTVLGAPRGPPVAATWPLAVLTVAAFVAAVATACRLPPKRLGP